MIQVVEEDGQVHVMGTRPGNLAFDSDIGSATLTLSQRDVHFRIALHDYMTALSAGLECPFYCYRAIEAVKCSFDPSDKGWSKMHAALGTSEGSIKSTIKVFADSVRHGNWLAIRSTTTADRNAMLVLTRDILHKYMVWSGAS